MATFEAYAEWAKQHGLKANKAKTLRLFFNQLKS